MSSFEFTLASGHAGGLTALADGSFLAVWDGSDGTVSGQIYNVDGTKKGESFAIASGLAGTKTNFTTTVLSDGRFVVGWEQINGMHKVQARIFDYDMKPVTDVFEISALNGEDQTKPQFVALRNGGFVAASINGATQTLKTVLIGPDGQQGAPLAIQDDAASISVDVMRNGNIIIVASKPTAAGYDMSQYIQDITDGSVTDATALDQIQELEDPQPHMIVLSTGGFIEAYDGFYDGNDSVEIYAFDPTGARLTFGTFFSNAGAKFGNAALKALPGGGYVFAYQIDGSVGSDVYIGHTVGSGAQGLTSTSAGDDYTIGDQTHPEITVLKDGRYLVSWWNDVAGTVDTRAEFHDLRSFGVTWTGGDRGEQYGGTAFGDRLSGGGGSDYIVGDDGSDDLHGDAGNDTMKGGTGNDALDGGSGIDTLIGDDGGDTYYVDDLQDQVIENGWGGSDKIVTFIDITLKSVIENLSAAGLGNLTLRGNGSANIISGNSANNTISGATGKDTLSGGAGHDVFVFNTKASKSNVDRITDFRVPDDSIDLDNAVFKALGRKGAMAHPVGLKKGAFWLGTKAHDKDDRIIYNKNTGALYYDADGSEKGAAIQIATLNKHLKMTYKDFFIV